MGSSMRKNESRKQQQENVRKNFNAQAKLKRKYTSGSRKIMSR